MEQVIILEGKEFLVSFISSNNKLTRINYKLPNIINVSLGKRSNSYNSIIDFIYKNKVKILNYFDKMKIYHEPDDKIFLFGKLYRLEFIKMKHPNLVTDETIYLKEQKNREVAVKKFRISQLTNFINNLNLIYQEKLASYNIPIIPFKIKDVKSYFGIFRKKKEKGITTCELCFSLFLSRLEPELIKHVFFHEYSHFIYANHSKSFYSLLYQLDENGILNKRKIKKVSII